MHIGLLRREADGISAPRARIGAAVDRKGSTPENPRPDDVPDDDPPPPAFTAPRGACDVSVRAGGFSVERQVDFGVIEGTILEGVVPTSVPSVSLVEGNCRLLERRNLACIPACVGAETCGESGTCIPYPRQLSVGEVSITGLTRVTTMSPLMPGNKYFAPGADNPPFDVLSPIVLSAAGAGVLPAFQLFGVGSEPLAAAPSWTIEAGTDWILEWPAPTSGAETSVLVELTIDQHGITPLMLSCVLEDTGSATVPASIIDQLVGSGISGFPNGRIVRRTADHIDLDIGCVDFVVGSPLAASISISGYTPCQSREDCSSEQTCNLALERCE